MTPPIEQTTKDGFDLQFGTNVIGMSLVHAMSISSSKNICTCRPLLSHKATASAPNRVGKDGPVWEGARGEHVVRGTQHGVRPRLRPLPGQPQAPQGGLDEAVRAEQVREYQTSRFTWRNWFNDHIIVSQATVVFSNELHRRYGNQGIVSTSLNPGNLKTELQRNGSKITTLLSVRAPRRAAQLRNGSLTRTPRPFAETSVVPGPDGCAHAAICGHNAPSCASRRAGAFIFCAMSSRAMPDT